MSPIEWFYAHDNRQTGPIPSGELKHLAEAGGLLPDDLVWREGMEQWIAARNVKGLFEASLPKAADTPSKAAVPFADVQPVTPMPTTAPGLPPEPGPTALDRPRTARPRFDRHVCDVLLNVLRAQFTAEFVESTTRIFVTCGHYCLYLAMLAGLAVASALAVKTGLADPVLHGAAWLLALVVLQYAARRFCGALDRLVRTTPSHVHTSVLLDTFALLSFVAGLAVLLGSAVLAVRSDAYSLILTGLVLFVVCEYLAVASLNPGTLGISVLTEAKAGEEAVGVLAFLLKAALRIAPVGFGAGVVCGTIWLLSACYLLFLPPQGPDAVADLLGSERLAELQSSVDPAVISEMLEIWPAQVTAFHAIRWILGFAALPFLAYVFCLLLHLLLEVIRAVLSLPAQLDRLPEAGEREQADGRE